MQHTQIRSLHKAWHELRIAEKFHVGFSVYDLQKRKSVFNYRADNYFTPGSNTKILTMYAALQMLEEQLDAALYHEKGDTLIIWGGGDPGTYYPDIETQAPLPEFIKTSKKTIVFSDDHFRTTRYGKGWAWDDYRYTFQCERNAFPIYGNRIWVRRSADSITVTPSYLSSLVKISTDTLTRTDRSEWGDGYFYIYNPKQKSAHVEMPITFFKNDIQYSWAQATGKEITFSDFSLPPDAHSVKGTPRDTLIKIMMQESDNFIAEQLLLACSLKGLHYMNEEAIIDSLLNGPLGDLQDTIYWVDGAGLSRYNLMTPRSIIKVLLHILEIKDIKYLTTVFPAGGESGTLKDGFKGKSGRPYIYAKSGSLRNTYCLSGLLMTKSGNVLLFSWMNNQFPGEAKEIKASMEKLFSFLYDNY